MDVAEVRLAKFDPARNALQTLRGHFEVGRIYIQPNEQTAWAQVLRKKRRVSAEPDCRVQYGLTGLGREVYAHRVRKDGNVVCSFFGRQDDDLDAQVWGLRHASVATQTAPLRTGE